MKIREAEREKYEKIWRLPDYRKHSPAARLLPRIYTHLDHHGINSVADLGCGSGRASLELARRSLTVTMVDIAENCLDDDVRVEIGDRFQVGCIWEPMTPLAQCVICCDVMEHIPTEKVDAVILNLKQYAHGFLQIALFKDGFGKMIGDTLHLTVKPADWWREKIGLGGSEENGNLVVRW